VSSIWSILAFLSGVVLVGLLVGLVNARARTVLQRTAIGFAVLLICAVAMVYLGATREASSPPFALVQFAIALLTAFPVVAGATFASFVAHHFRLSHVATLVGPTLVAVVVSPLCIFMALGAACSLTGNCL
jgi:hypothetical protein